MRLNLKQKRIVIIAMVLVGLVLLFPHWLRLTPQGQVLQDMGYSFFTDPPKYGAYQNEMSSRWVVIDYSGYLVKIGILLVLATGGVLIARD